MKAPNTPWGQIVLRAGLSWLVTAAAGPLLAATVWNGPNIGFYHTQENNLADNMTSRVAITRGSSLGLYNSIQEAGATSGISPKDTQWAIGSLANFATLTYGPCPLEQFDFPPSYVGTTFVVHLVTEDIYLSLTLTNWGGSGGVGDKTFGYVRSTAGVVAPSVTLTNPANGAVFAAPATVNLGASASVSSGTVTNVQFFTNNAPLASDTTAPFGVTGTLGAGSYALKAVATAGGISATSAVVNITVVTPGTVVLSGVKVQGGQFSFNYTAQTGLSYFVERSSNLVNWVSVLTNLAPGTVVPYSETFNPSGGKFYRVGRLPNP